MNHVAMMRLPLPLASAPQREAEEKAACANKKYRVLLALDGRHVTAELQLAALKCCVQFSNRLDILLLNPPKPPTFLLSGLLLRLEHSGIDYRMTSGEGDLANPSLTRIAPISLFFPHRHPASPVKPLVFS